MVVFRFGRLDDFSFYLYSRNDLQGVINSGFSFGRPITTFIIGNTIGSVGNIDGFSLIRAGSLIILLFVVYLSSTFYKLTNKPISIWPFFLLFYFMSLPGLWVFMSWAQGLPHVLGMLFVLISVMAYCRPRYQKYFYVFSFLAIFTYQPFGLLIPILLVPKLFQEETRNIVREFVKIYLWVFSLCLINYLVVKSQAEPNARSQITSDYLEKMSWFVSEWIPRVLFPWSLKVNLIGSAVMGMIFLALLMDFAKKMELRLSMILVSSIGLPSLPFLITGENWASSRAILASNISFAIGLFFLASKYHSLRKSDFILKFAALGVATIFFFNSIFVGYGSLVLPQNQEWKNTLRDMAIVPSETREIIAHLSFFEQSSSISFSYDEFGVLNSSVPDALGGMIKMAMASFWLKNVPTNIDTERKCQKVASTFEEKTKSFNLYPLAGMPGC
jgi:hypothetical protein